MAERAMTVREVVQELELGVAQGRWTFDTPVKSEGCDCIEDATHIEADDYGDNPRGGLHVVICR